MRLQSLAAALAIVSSTLVALPARAFDPAKVKLPTKAPHKTTHKSKAHASHKPGPLTAAQINAVHQQLARTLHNQALVEANRAVTLSPAHLRDGKAWAYLSGVDSVIPVDNPTPLAVTRELWVVFPAVAGSLYLVDCSVDPGDAIEGLLGSVQLLGGYGSVFATNDIGALPNQGGHVLVPVLAEEAGQSAVSLKSGSSGQLFAWYSCTVTPAKLQQQH